MVSSKDSVETLKGTSLDIYRFMLTSNKPVGIRELARELDLSSPSVAQHHLIRLEEMGLVKREWGNYAINKVVLQNHIKINHLLIPRPTIYLLFVIGALLIELAAYPAVSLQVYLIALFIQITVVAIFIYETIKIWQNGRL